MAKYIKQNVITKRIMAAKWIDGYDGAMAMQIAASAPTADVVEMVYGRWINITRFNDGERIIATCSHCKDRGDIRTIRTEFGIWEINSPYCPNCGAKMQEVE